MTKKLKTDPATAAPPDFGRALTGLGINLLVPSIGREVDFLKDVLALELVRADKDFAVLRYGEQLFLLHADHTYRDHPLLTLTGDGALRGIGLELRLYGRDPDEAEAKAVAGGYDVLAPARHKPHGLRECFLISPTGYVWVPSVHSHELD